LYSAGRAVDFERPQGYEMKAITLGGLRIRLSEETVASA